MFLLTSHYYMYIYLSCLLKLLYINTNVIHKHVPHEPVTDVIFYGRLLKIATKSDTLLLHIVHVHALHVTLPKILLVF